jgi:hypothetical protein
MSITLSERTQIIELTTLMFNAAPGATYLSDVVSAYEALGHNMQALAVALAGTGAYQTLNPNFQTADEFAAAFLTPLGLEGDALAHDFITSRFTAGESKGQIAFEAFTALNGVTAADGAQYVAAKAILDNKTEVASYYSVDKAIAQTDLNTLQLVLSGVTGDDTTVTSTEAAINNGTLGVSGIDATLSPQQDTITGSNASDKVAGLFGSGTASDNTYTVGDSIDLGAGSDQLNLVALGANPSGAISVKNVETINISDTVGATFNALLVENAPAINFTNTLAGQTSMVTNAALASVMGLSGKGNLTVDYASTSGTADTAAVSLNGVGTSSTVRSTVDVSDGNTVEAVSVATAGTNFVTLNAGSAAKTITVTGSGTNTITVASDATTSTIDASASSGTNTFNLGTSLSNGDVIKGGTGADTVSFNAVTAIGAVTFTGVETIKADIDVDASLSLAGSTGIHTIILDGGTGSATFTNAASDLTAVNITSQGDTDNTLNLSYATGNTGTLALNVGSSTSSAANITMGDVTLTRVDSFTLNGVGTKTLALGAINLGNTVHDITVAAGTSDMSTGNINAGTGLTSLNVSTGAGGLLSIGDVISTGSDVAVGVNVGASGSAYVSYVSAGSFANIDMTVGAHGNADLNSVYASAGGFGNISATVGSGGSAYIDATTNSSTSGGNIGDVSLTLASGATGDIYGYAYSGDAGNVSMDTGAHTSGYIYVSAYSYSGADGKYSGGGNVGNVTVNAHGTNASASAIVSGVDGFSGAGGNVGTIDVTVNGTDAHAYVSAYAYQYASSGSEGGVVGDITMNISGAGAVGEVSAFAYGGLGHIGNINMTVAGAAASGYLYVEGSGSDGSIGNINVAVGAGGSAYMDGYAYESGTGDHGNIGNLTLAQGDSTSGYFNLDASGSVGTTSVTAGNSASVTVDAYGYSGDVGAVTATMGSAAYFSGYFSAGSGMAGAATVTVGQDSTAHITLEGSAGVGAISVTAGVGSNVYAQSHGEAGNVGAITITGGDTGDYASAYASAGSIDAVNLGGWAGTYNIDLSSVTQGTVITAGADGGTVNATIGADVINGGAGADTLDGNVSADVINGGGGADTIDGGAGADAINGGAGKDTMTGGTEADTFIFGSDSMVTAKAITAFTTSTDVITDFVSATDKMDFTTAGSVTNFTESTADAGTLAAMLGAADTALNGTVKYYFGNVGGTGYLVYSADGTNATAVVELTGIGATGIAATDIV